MSVILEDLDLGIVNLKNKELEEEKEHQKYLKRMMYL